VNSTDRQPGSAAPIRNSAKALIVRDGRLLLTRNVGWRGDEYFILPGGGQEHGETLAAALQRECLEEIGATVRVLSLRYIREYIGKHHAFAERHSGVHALEFMFVCELLDEPGTHAQSNPDAGQTGMVWLPPGELKRHQIFPAVLGELIAADGTLTGPVYLGDVN